MSRWRSQQKKDEYHGTNGFKQSHWLPMKLSNNPLWIENRMTRVVFDALLQLAQVWYFFLHPSIIFKYKDENLWRQSELSERWHIQSFGGGIGDSRGGKSCISGSQLSSLPVSEPLISRRGIDSKSNLTQVANWLCCHGWISKQWKKNPATRQTIWQRRRGEKSLDHWPCSGWVLITHSLFLFHFFRSLQSQKWSITSPFLRPLLCFEHLAKAKLSQFTFPLT